MNETRVAEAIQQGYEVVGYWHGEPIFRWQARAGTDRAEVYLGACKWTVANPWPSYRQATLRSVADTYDVLTVGANVDTDAEILEVLAALVTALHTTGSPKLPDIEDEIRLAARDYHRLLSFELEAYSDAKQRQVVKAPTVWERIQRDD